MEHPVITYIKWAEYGGYECGGLGMKGGINDKIYSGISLDALLDLFGVDIRNDYPDDFRLKYPTNKRSEDGHLVRSRGELLIDNWLYNHGFTHSYEKYVPIKEHLLCDFYLNEQDIYIEYWGIDYDYYRRRREFKEHLYYKYELNLLSIENENIEKIDDFLTKSLLK